MGDEVEVITCRKSKVECVCTRQVGRYIPDRLVVYREARTYVRVISTSIPGDESVKLFWIGLRRLVQKKLSDKCHISSRGHNAVQCSHLASQNRARARDNSTARERVMKCERGGRVVFG